MAKYKFIFLLLFVAVVARPSHAQFRSESLFHAYPVVGVTVNQIEGDYLKGFKKWGFTGGVGTEVRLSDNGRWKLSMEADFSQRGVRETNRNSQIPYLVDLTLNYIDIGLMGHFVDPFGGIMLGVGLTYSRLVQQPHGTLSFNPEYVVPDTTDMTFLKNDLAIAGSLDKTVDVECALSPSAHADSHQRQKNQYFLHIITFNTFLNKQLLYSIILWKYLSINNDYFL